MQHIKGKQHMLHMSARHSKSKKQKLTTECCCHIHQHKDSESKGHGNGNHPGVVQQTICWCSCRKKECCSTIHLQASTIESMCICTNSRIRADAFEHVSPCTHIPPHELVCSLVCRTLIWHVGMQMLCPWGGALSASITASSSSSLL